MEREEGPVEILCKEIGFRFHRSMETEAIFTRFVKVLVDQIGSLRAMDESLFGVLKSAGPSEGSKRVLDATQEMLSAPDRQTKIERAAQVHDLSHELNPEDTYPTDHLIDMLSSCASAIRFGLETPCRSRHAAAAAKHVWEKLYGVRRFDDFTSKWANDWICAQLQSAILQLAHHPAEATAA